MGLYEKPHYIREGFFLVVGKGDTKRSAVRKEEGKEKREKMSSGTGEE